MSADERLVGSLDEFSPGRLAGAGEYVVGNSQGELFALGRTCPHRGGDLSLGNIDEEGCLVCPRHGARFDVKTGLMVSGPRIPPGRLVKAMTNRRRPLARAEALVRDGDVYLREEQQVSVERARSGTP